MAVYLCTETNRDRKMKKNMFFFFLRFFIYLLDRDTARVGTQAGRVGEGEADSLPSREPDVGLSPRTLGS